MDKVTTPSNNIGDFSGLKSALTNAFLAAGQAWKLPEGQEACCPGHIGRGQPVETPVPTQTTDNPYVKAYAEVMRQNAEKFRHPFKEGSLEALRTQLLQSRDLHERLTLMAKVIEKSDKILELADSVEELGEVLEEEIAVVSRCQKAAAAHRKAELAMLKGFEEQLS